MLRDFLLIAPREGLIFRATMATPGSRMHSWKSASTLAWQFDGRGHKVLVPQCEGFKSGKWNDNMRRILRQACPAFNADCVTSHSLRSGGATAALRVLGAKICPVVQQMLCHKSLDSTMSYVRPTIGQLRGAHASVSSASSSSRSAHGGLSGATL